MKIEKLLDSKYKWWIVVASVVVLISIILLVFNFSKNDKNVKTPTDEVYETITKIKEENLTSSPLLKLYDMYDKGEIPNYAGYYQDVTGMSSAVTIKLKGLNEEEINKIKDFDENAIFTFEDCDYTMKELETSFKLITQNQDIMALTESVSIDIINNRIIIRTTVIDDIVEALDTLEMDTNMFTVTDINEG